MISEFFRVPVSVPISNEYWAPQHTYVLLGTPFQVVKILLNFHHYLNEIPFVQFHFPKCTEVILSDVGVTKIFSSQFFKCTLQVWLPFM